MVEVIMKVIAEGKHLLKHKVEVFDSVVVVVSFTMDIAFIIVPVSQAAKDYAGLLVLLRLWRITRIINGAINFLICIIALCCIPASSVDIRDSSMVVATEQTTSETVAVWPVS